MDTVFLNDYKIFSDDINVIVISNEQIVINTINSHSYIVAKHDDVFKKALLESDILLPDGEGIVLMARVLCLTLLLKQKNGLLAGLSI